MASELVFLIEMGPQQSKLFGSEEALAQSVGEEREDDGYVTRGIRMVREALLVISPVLEFKWRATEVEVVVRGCASANLTSLTAI